MQHGMQAIRKHDPRCRCPGCVPAHGYLGATKTDSSPWDFNREKAWIETPTLDGDTLSSLSRAYGVSAQEITDANDVPFSSTAINQWVVSSGGKYRSGSSGETVFTGKSKIMLPNKARGAKSPVTGNPPVVKTGDIPKNISGSKSNVLFWSLAGGAAILGTVAVIGMRGKKVKQK